MNKDAEPTSLISLPGEILETIFEHLTKEDVIKLSSTSHKFRQRLVSFIMKEIKASWEQIIVVHKHNLPKEFTHEHEVLQLRITDSNSYNEYQMNTFLQLLSPHTFPALLRVLVNSCNLSYWLKYNESTCITHLTLYSEETLKGVKTFNLSHVNNFPNLRLLSLQKYHFNWTEEMVLKVPSAPITELYLYDCTWEYPFNLASFNRLNLLQSLTIYYTQNNPFTLLERFESFLKNPLPLHLDSLRELSVGYIDYTQNIRYLSPRILAQFMMRFPNIQHFAFKGWAADSGSLKSFLASVARDSPFTLHLQLYNMHERDRDLLRQLQVPQVRIKWC